MSGMTGLDRRALLGGLLGAGALAALEGCSPTPARVPAATAPAVSTAPGPTATAVPGPVADADWARLRSSLGGSLAMPADPAYDARRQLFNRRFDDLRPAAVASVASEADVQACLAFARAHAVPLSVRSGGHSYLGASAGPGLVVDLRRLSQVSAAAGRATVGGGAALVDVYAGLAASGASVPGGSCPAVGLSGLALGGGTGVVARRYGLTCDRLVSARVALPDGRLVTASADSEPDLFWALRGGGGSYGVVTSLELLTHPTTDLATFTVSWPWAAAAEVLSGWQEGLAGAPDGLWTTCHLLSTTGRAATASVSGVLVGPQGQLETLVDALVAAVGSAPASRSVRTRGYLDTMLLEAGCSGKTAAQCHVAGQAPGGTLARDAFVAASDVFPRPLSPSAVARVVTTVSQRQESGLGVGGAGFDSWGGAVGRVAPDATAFPHRDALLSAQWTASWAQTPGNGPQAANEASLAALRAAAAGEGSGSYANYADATLADPLTAYYGANLARLRSVKQAYDPEGLLDQPQGVRA